MRTRFLPIVALAIWPFVVACAVEDPDVDAGGTTTIDEPPTSDSTTTSSSTSSSTTPSTTPSTSAVDTDDVVAALEDEGYEVVLLEMEAPSARPDDATGHQLLEVDGADLPYPTQIELWTFESLDDAEDGEDEVRDEATDEAATGGSWVTRNATVVALLGCTCEGESMLADVFGDLELGGPATPSDDPAPTTSTTRPSDPHVSIPDDEPHADDGRLESVIAELEAAGAEVTDTSSEVDEDLGATVAATVEVEVDGEVEDLEIHVFDDADLAFEVAMEVEADADERCGDVCDELQPVAVPVGEVVFVAVEGDAVLDLLGDLELP